MIYFRIATMAFAVAFGGTMGVGYGKRTLDYFGNRCRKVLKKRMRMVIKRVP